MNEAEAGAAAGESQKAKQAEVASALQNKCKSIDESKQIWDLFCHFLKQNRTVLLVSLMVFLLVAPWAIGHIQDRLGEQLRWSVIAIRHIACGTALTPENTGLALRGVRGDAGVVTARGEALGRRTIVTIPRGREVVESSLEDWSLMGDDLSPPCTVEEPPAEVEDEPVNALPKVLEAHIADKARRCPRCILSRQSMML